MYSVFLHRLGRSGLSIFFGRPGLKLIEQRFGSCLIDFSLTFEGRFKSGKQFIARRGSRQDLGAGN